MHLHFNWYPEFLTQHQHYQMHFEKKTYIFIPTFFSKLKSFLKETEKSLMKNEQKTYLHKSYTSGRPNRNGATTDVFS